MHTFFIIFWIGQYLWSLVQKLKLMPCFLCFLSDESNWILFLFMPGWMALLTVSLIAYLSILSYLPINNQQQICWLRWLCDWYFHWIILMCLMIIRANMSWSFRADKSWSCIVFCWIENLSLCNLIHFKTFISMAMVFALLIRLSSNLVCCWTEVWIIPIFTIKF